MIWELNVPVIIEKVSMNLGLLIPSSPQKNILLLNYFGKKDTLVGEVMSIVILANVIQEV